MQVDTAYLIDLMLDFRMSYCILTSNTMHVL